MNIAIRGLVIATEALCSLQTDLRVIVASVPKNVFGP